MLNINQLVVIGGGRWSRQIIKTLLKKIKVKKILCITSSRNFFLKKWVKKID